MALQITRALFQLELQTSSAPPQGDVFLRVAGYGIRIQPIRLRRTSAPPHVCNLHYPEQDTQLGGVELSHSPRKRGSVFVDREPLYFFVGLF